MFVECGAQNAEQTGPLIHLYLTNCQGIVMQRCASSTGVAKLIGQPGLNIAGYQGLHGGAAEKYQATDCVSSTWPCHWQYSAARDRHVGAVKPYG